MPPVKNIQRILTAVFIMTVISLFFTGVHAGNADVNASYANTPAASASFAGQYKKQDPLQLHKSSPIAFFHKNQVRRSRHRNGGDPLYVTDLKLRTLLVIAIYSNDTQESFSTVIFHAPTLRGPPCA